MKKRPQGEDEVEDEVHNEVHNRGGKWGQRWNGQCGWEEAGMARMEMGPSTKSMTAVPSGVLTLPLLLCRLHKTSSVRSLTSAVPHPNHLAILYAPSIDMGRAFMRSWVCVPFLLDCFKPCTTTAAHVHLPKTLAYKIGLPP